MRIAASTLFLLSLLFVASFCGCAKQDKVIGVAADDPEMLTAIAKARSLLPQFWQTFDKPEHGESHFALKVMLSDAHGTEHFWLVDLERKEGKMLGTINNDPEIVKNVKLGQRVPITETNISDWLYQRDGKMVGNYTLRAMLKQMTPKEVEKYKKLLADP